MTLVYLAAAWVAGIALARVVHPPWQLLALLGFFSVLGLLLWWEDHRLRLAAFSLLMVGLGAARLLLTLPHFDDASLATYNGAGWVTLEGVVVGEPDDRDAHTNLRFRAERLLLPDGTEREVEGLALIQTDRYPRRTHGDRLRIRGLLTDPPTWQGSSYREYLARRGIYSFVRRARVEDVDEGGARSLAGHLFACKQRAQSVISQMLPEPQASLLTGILLGVETGIPDGVMEAFEATGTSHIIAISGFNITIVAGIFAGIAGRFLHRRRALLTAMAGVAVYTVLVGASPAVVRAALMGCLYLFARYVGRRSYPSISLSAAALIMTAWNPHTLWDRGFQLSFAATAGLLFYTEPLERLSQRALERISSPERARRVVNLVSDTLLVTVAAQITTTPILVRSFRRVSLVTLLSNLLVLPIQPHVMLAGGTATLLGLIVRPLGRAVGWVAWLFLSYTVEMVRLTARAPLASVSVEAADWMVWGYYLLLVPATWWLVTPRKRRRELWNRLRRWLSSQVEAKLLLGASGVLLALAVLAWRGLPDGRLHVHALDVGQGDAVFVQTPSGRQVLIDGGPSGDVLLSRLGRRMPFWDRSLDLVVLTHPDADHITGLVAVLERYQVDGVVFREMGCDEPICRRWRELLDEGDVAIHQGEAGLAFDLDEGVRMEVLHPGPELLVGEGFNDNSLVMRLSHGTVSMLLTGDIEERAEKRLLAEDVELRSTVLKVAHHGACGSSTPAFLEAVGPEVAVISVGENDFGHPCDEVVERLETVLDGVAGEPPIYRTDEDGTVELVSDGSRLWMETERLW
jgi:competence protein ComEC